MERSSPVVLVVEDESIQSEQLEASLVREGYRVQKVPNTALGLVCIAAGGVDLVVLNSSDTWADSADLCRKVREEQGETYLPIVVLAPNAATELRHAMFAAGASDCVTEPLDLGELVDRICAWVGARQTAQVANQTRALEAIYAGLLIVRQHQAQSLMFCLALEEVAGQQTEPGMLARLEQALRVRTKGLTHDIRRLALAEQYYAVALRTR
jgi:DNA-binding response OmpR family regulator